MLDFESRSDMPPDEPIEHDLLRSAVAAEITVTSTDVSPTSTGDRHVRIEGRLGDDEESHVEWAAVGFIYALGLLSFAAARPRGVSGMHFEKHDHWTAADMLRHLRYERGRLVCETDYVRGADDEDGRDGLPGWPVHAHHNESR